MTNQTLQTKIFQLFSPHKIFLVGGTVREMLLSGDRLPLSVEDRRSSELPDGQNSVKTAISANDLDFAVSCEPSETKRILEEAGYKTHDVGKAYGTISIIENGQKIEITTFRRDVSYARDNRHPVVEWGKTIEEDLARRDFRINCIALDSNNNLIDPFNGVSDLKNKIINTPIEPEKSFSDDPLRLIRCVRFKTKLGFQYSERVKTALKSQAHRLLILPKERVLDELNKIIMTNDPAGAFNDLFEFHILHYIIPELALLSKIEQTSIYHSKNVWLHTVEALRNSPKDLVLRWSIIFHDLGKMSTMSVEDGCIHFYHHEQCSFLMAQSIMHRLGFPKQMAKDICYLVGSHMRVNTYSKEWSDASIRRFIRDTGEYCNLLLELSRCDITSHRAERIQMHLDDLDDLCKRIEEQRNFKESPKCPISGLDIMSYFDLPPCKKVGEIKDLILNAIINGDLKQDDSEEEMLGYAKRKNRDEK